MITIHVGNSECHAVGLTAARLQELRKITSYREVTGRWIPVKKKDGTTRKIQQEIIRHLMDKRGKFPTGLLYVVEAYLKKHKIGHVLEDARIVPTAKLPLKATYPFAPYLEQQEAANAAVLEGRGIIAAPTGVGKSLICAAIIDGLKVKTLVVVPSLGLKKQVTDGLKEIFPGQVGPLVKDNCHFPITVENVDALEPKKTLAVDCVIIDEFHHSGAKTYRTLNKHALKNCYYKFGLTATPFRSRDAEQVLLESVLSKIIYRVDYQVAVDKKYIVPMEVYYVELPKTKCEAKTWHGVYKHLIVDREDRNLHIANLAENLYNAGKSTLVLTKQIDHGGNLADILAERGIMVPFAKGENDNNKELIRDFNSQTEPVLVGTMGVIGEGIDTKPAEYIILAGGGKSKNQFMQNLGRGFRNFPGKETCKIILFYDPSNKWLVEHFKACCEYLREEYGIIPSKLDL